MKRPCRPDGIERLIFGKRGIQDENQDIFGGLDVHVNADVAQVKYSNLG